MLVKYTVSEFWSAKGSFSSIDVPPSISVCYCRPKDRLKSVVDVDITPVNLYQHGGNTNFAIFAGDRDGTT